MGPAGIDGHGSARVIATFTGPSIRLVLSYLARAGNARWLVLVSVVSWLGEEEEL